MKDNREDIKSSYEDKVPKVKKHIHRVVKLLIVEGLILAALLICLSVIKLPQRVNGVSNQNVKQVFAQGEEKVKEGNLENQDQLMKEEEEQSKKNRENYLLEAKRFADSYDYEKAIEYVKAYKEDYQQFQEFQRAITDFENKKAECVRFGAYDNATQVNHIFFHSLIYDTSKAFDNQYDSNGYNYYMTTVTEFKEMLRQMYENDYVLVSIHDLVRKTVKEDGTTTYAEGDIMLPPNKKPFVLSQDDVNYYDYMDKDGFASRVVLDENQRPSVEMILEDGTSSIGDYDLIPILETFIEEYPDFSYRGARGIIALTGYEGALGYRTDPASKNSTTYKEDREAVKKVAKVMREYGWEFACHSNGHRDMAACTQKFLEYDTNQWLENVGSLVGETDLYVYPYGIDVQQGIGTYSNAKYQFLKKSGFSIFFGVEAKPWMQIKKDYVRMQRRPLDGQAMIQYPERLKDLFDLTTLVDQTRPKMK